MATNKPLTHLCPKLTVKEAGLCHRHQVRIFIVFYMTGRDIVHMITFMISLTLEIHYAIKMNSDSLYSVKFPFLCDVSQKDTYDQLVEVHAILLFYPTILPDR